MRVLVTGAATGIGAATAATLRRGGAEITAIDIADPGAAVDRWIEADLSDPGAIAALPLEGRFDALVNAAGLPPRAGLEEKILALNVFGLRQMTETALPHLAQGASIVNVASKAGARWQENLDQVRRLLALDGPGALTVFIAAEGIDPVRAYDLSKEAVIVWTRFETARLQSLGLRANSVSPAAVETRLLADFMTAFGARAERGVALTGRPGTADEIGAVAAFLARPESGWIRGVDLPVDGGLTALLDIEKLSA